MERTDTPIVLTSEIMSSAMNAAFLSAAKRAKDTDTYLVVMENDHIRKIPAHEIDAYIAGPWPKNQPK